MLQSRHLCFLISKILFAGRFRDMLNKWVWIFLLVEMICFNSADALLLPFSSMQLSSSLMGHTGIQFNLQILGLARLCGLLSIPSVIMSNSTFSFEILYWYFDSLIGILNCIYNFIIYWFCYKRLLLLSYMTGLWQVVRWCRSTLLLYYSGKNQSVWYLMSWSKLTISMSEI